MNGFTDCFQIFILVHVPKSKAKFRLEVQRSKGPCWASTGLFVRFKKNVYLCSGNVDRGEANTIAPGDASGFPSNEKSSGASTNTSKILLPDTVVHGFC